MYLIETRDLCQRYQERDVLKKINIGVERGEVFTLIGPTGVGKTTLLRLLGLIDQPQSGKILINGMDTAVSGRSRLEMRRRLAFVLQKPVVFNASVFDNIASGLRWRGINKNEIRHRVDNLLDIVGLTDYRDRNARRLSGGEVQQVAIARAIAVEPDLLLLDEPTANLDPVAALRVEELIMRIIAQRATTIILATHDLAQGQRLADRIGVLVDGEIQQTGSYSDLFTSPINRAVARFVGVENILDGVILSSEDRVVSIDIGGNIIEAISDFVAGEKVAACIRPEDITLSLSPISSSARNSFAGTVVRVVSFRPLSRLELDCGFPLVCLITRKSAEEMALTPGKPVYAVFKATGVHVIGDG